ncbi:uncharacterized protein PAC_20124 [Phialocephala subalpina]|uniref:Uncharacterized protein n=1 Tax=Phialocephala subalpina TaxID=576137 RepID=A0A1L7XYR9_9HELO|nr:uncharacterized protein PAC_20124 [Phialocephala subalpina]
MVKKITIIAILAALATAAPVSNDISPRTWPLPSFPKFGTSTGSITATKGWSTGVASGLEACAIGATSGIIDSVDKAALASWIAGEGAAFFDAITCKEITAWCTGTEVVLGAATLTAMEGALIVESSISAAGGILSFFNGVIESGFGGAACACAALDGGDRGSLSTFLSGSGAAALKSTIFGSLHMCASGCIAESLSASAKEALSAWLSGSSCPLSEGLKGSVQGWLLGGASIGGSISGSAGGNVIFGGSAMGSLTAYMSGSAFAGLSMDIQGVLHACAAGGVSGSLSGAMKSSFSAWLSSSSCTFDAGLKASMQAWLSGTVSVSTQAGTSADAYEYISISGSISGNFNAAGSMVAGAQASLSSFCSGSGGLALEAGILGSLQSCAAGELSASLESTATSALAQWLASSSCPLDVEMRGSVMMWLSFGITGASGTSAGIGMGAGAGFSISGSMVGEFSSAISGEFNLSPTCKGAMGVAIAGEAAWGVSAAGRAEMCGFLVSGEGASMSTDVQAALFGWVMGSDCSGVKSAGVSTSSGSSSSGSSSAETSSTATSSSGYSYSTGASSPGSSSSSPGSYQYSGSSTGEQSSGDDDSCDA